MKLIINEKGRYIHVAVEQITEAYGWHDSKTCIVEYVGIVTDNFGTTKQFKTSTLVFEPIENVIHKIEKERARKDLKINDRQKAVFSRWKVKA